MFENGLFVYSAGDGEKFSSGGTLDNDGPKRDAYTREAKK